ncbi:MAG: hypothetical protein ABII74_00085 [Elusimicrobiota bacterium]
MKNNSPFLNLFFKLKRFFLIIFILFFIPPFAVFSEEKTVSGSEIVVVDDFNSGSFVNRLGNNSGYWQVNPVDRSQYCRAVFDPQEKIGDKGNSLRLDFDIDSDLTYTDNIPNAAFNGYYTKLGGIDLTGYKYLIFYVKGDRKRGFTRSFKIELQNARRGNASRGSYTVEWITGKWQKFVVPLWEFRDLRSLNPIDEFTIVFDRLVTNKEGTIYIDNIYFAKEKTAEIK